MKHNAIGLISRGAEALRARGDSGVAYALYELANNLRLLMRDECSLDEWKRAYVGADSKAIDLDALFPDTEAA